MHLKKAYLILLFTIGTISGVFVYFRYFYSYNINIFQDNFSKVCFQDKCLDVEVAITPEQHTKGLMYRASLGEDEGMLFVFEQLGIYNFWMKNTFINLDMIWLDEDGKIVYIFPNAKPCNEITTCMIISPGQQAKYVLELNGGKSSSLGMKIGDKLDINIK